MIAIAQIKHWRFTKALRYQKSDSVDKASELNYASQKQKSPSDNRKAEGVISYIGVCTGIRRGPVETVRYGETVRSVYRCKGQYSVS